MSKNLKTPFFHLFPITLRTYTWKHKTDFEDFVFESNLNRVIIQGTIYLSAGCVQSCKYWWLKSKNVFLYAAVTLMIDLPKCCKMWRTFDHAVSQHMLNLLSNQISALKKFQKLLIKSQNVPKTTIKTHGFSTHYTTVPHDKWTPVVNSGFILNTHGTQYHLSYQNPF
jgi:hypothetical protein